MTPDPLRCLENAQRAIDAERDRPRREKEAFRAFLDRIDELESEPSRGNGNQPETPDAVRVQHRSVCATTDAVWRAYSETVLAVPHFESDYPETPIEHLQAELGADVASLLTQPNALTQHHKAAIRSRAGASIESRDEQLQKMDEESRMVEQAEEAITAAQTALEDLDSQTIIDMPMEDVENTST